MARDLRNPLAGSEFDKGKKKKVKKTTTGSSGPYPYNIKNKKTVVTKTDKSGSIKKKKEKFVEGKKDEKPSYKSKTTTKYSKDNKGSVGKTKTKSATYGKSKIYTTTDYDAKGRSYGKEITKKEYKRKKRNL